MQIELKKNKTGVCITPYISDREYEILHEFGFGDITLSYNRRFQSYTDMIEFLEKYSCIIKNLLEGASINKFSDIPCGIMSSYGLPRNILKRFSERILISKNTLLPISLMDINWEDFLLKDKDCLIEISLNVKKLEGDRIERKKNKDNIELQW
jgi:hypothetical protein